MHSHHLRTKIIALKKKKPMLYRGDEKSSTSIHQEPRLYCLKIRDINISHYTGLGSVPTIKRHKMFCRKYVIRSAHAPLDHLRKAEQPTQAIIVNYTLITLWQCTHTAVNSSTSKLQQSQERILFIQWGLRLDNIPHTNIKLSTENSGHIIV